MIFLMLFGFFMVIGIAIFILIPFQRILLIWGFFSYWFHVFAATSVGYLLALAYEIWSLSNLNNFLVGEEIYVLDGSILQAGWLLASTKAFMDAIIFTIVGSFIWLVFVRSAVKDKKCDYKN